MKSKFLVRNKSDFKPVIIENISRPETPLLINSYSDTVTLELLDSDEEDMKNFFSEVI